MHDVLPRMKPAVICSQLFIVRAKTLRMAAFLNTTKRDCKYYHAT